ncbi:MAG: hypothetical protein ACE5DO_02200 [Desulfobacterales bacterium]
MSQENDIVLLYVEDKPLVFARIEEIFPDIKAGWYHVKLLFLQLPLQSVTWILRDSYINGDPFTMDGKNIRLERVICPENSEKEETPLNKKFSKKGSRSAKVISLKDMKKNT